MASGSDTMPASRPETILRSGSTVHATGTRENVHRERAAGELKMRDSKLFVRLNRSTSAAPMPTRLVLGSDEL
jgi:hypothetical protein